MLTLLVSLAVPIARIKKYGTKNGLPVRKSFKINGIFQKFGVIYDTSIYMRNKHDFKIGPFFKMTLVKFE